MKSVYWKSEHDSGQRQNSLECVPCYLICLTIIVVVQAIGMNQDRNEKDVCEGFNTSFSPQGSLLNLVQAF